MTLSIETRQMYRHQEERHIYHTYRVPDLLSDSFFPLQIPQHQQAVCPTAQHPVSRKAYVKAYTEA